MSKPVCINKTEEENMICFRGMRSEDDDALGACDDGYQNTLCADCAVDYSRTSIWMRILH